MRDDDIDCRRCGQTMTLGDGLEPTDYCNLCAQELVEELLEEKREALHIAYTRTLDTQTLGEAVQALIDALDKARQQRDFFERELQTLKEINAAGAAANVDQNRRLDELARMNAALRKKLSAVVMTLQANDQEASGLCMCDTIPAARGEGMLTVVHAVADVLAELSEGQEQWVAETFAEAEKRGGYYMPFAKKEDP
jgi:hypothetical protein